MQELEMRLRNDLSKIGLDVKFNLLIKPYSKSYFGRYDIATSTIILYVYKIPEKEMYSYEELLLTTIHEAIHCLQWSNPNYKRVKGVMHDVEFKKLYDMYSNRAKARIMLKEMIRNYVDSHKEVDRKVYDFCGVCH